MAVTIAARIRAEAVRVRGGGVTWLAPSLGGRRSQLDPHLYGGSTGTLFFLAGLDHLRGTSEHHETIRASMEPLRRMITELASDPQRAARRSLPIGGMIGIGSFIYAFVRCGTWLGDQDLLQAARAAACLLTRKRIAADTHLDVVRGGPGAILALLALDAGTPATGLEGPAPLDRARACADHLLATCGFAAKPQGDGAPATVRLGTGFAHGAAGAGYALLRLFQRTGDERLRDAALAFFTTERALLDPLVRSERGIVEAPAHLQAWCSGLPGLALSLLPGAALEGADDIRRDLSAAVARILTEPPGENDTLCCGNLGRADVLLSVAAATGASTIVGAAAALAASRIHAVQETRGPPSLFVGSAGIGYSLLRIAAPGRLPSVLALE